LRIYGHATELVLRVVAIRNVRMYQVRCTLHPWDGKEESWEPAGTFRNSRSMRVGNLKPGKMYAFQVRALGGSTGSGDWSDPVSHMCM